MADKDTSAKTRKARPVYAIMSVTDTDGKPLMLTKENVTIHSVHKDADEVLEMLEAGHAPGTFHKRIAF